MATNELRANAAFWDNWHNIAQHPERFKDRPRPIPFTITARVEDDTDTRVTVEVSPSQARLIYQSLGEYVSKGWRFNSTPPD
jgi:hypothetical protein